MSGADTGRLDQLFSIFEQAAIAGVRCPTLEELPSASSTTASALARQGKVLIEISGRNWRTVTILVGPNKGRSTAPDPNGHHVWRSIGQQHLMHGKPWKPRTWQEREAERSRRIRNIA